MNKFVLTALIGLFLSTPVLAAPVANTDVVQTTSVEHVLWDKIPIAFVVPEGQERLLIFSGPVKFKGSANAALTQDLVTVLNNAGTLYIKAKKAFDPIRIPVELTETGEVILVDVSSQPNADDVPMQVVIKKTELDPSHETALADEAHTIPTLIRYVAQRACAECGPKSAEEALDHVERAPMATSRFVHLIDNENITCMPIASWKSGTYYATAIRIKNLSQRRLLLKPQAIKGDFRAATFLPTNVLNASGQFDDRITLVVVSEKPFGSALTPTRGYFGE